MAVVLALGAATPAQDPGRETEPRRGLELRHCIPPRWVSFGVRAEAPAWAPDGKHLVVGLYIGSSYVVMPIAEDGSLGAASHEVMQEGSGPNEARQQAEISDGIERVIFEELTGIFEAMAQIKYQASVAHRSDISFDWTEYEELARKRDDLLALIEHAQ